MKGINFIEPSYHKVVSGEITQMRKIINPLSDFKVTEHIKPEYKIGEILFIMEQYITYQVLNHIKHQDGRSFSEISDGMIGYKYDGHDSVDDFVRHVYLMGGIDIEKVYVKQEFWNHELSMPEKYARRFVEITGIRFERMQDISDEDCMKEGIREEQLMYFPYIITHYVIPDMSCPLFSNPREAYAYFVNKVYGEGTWESNPSVPVYEFKLTQ